MNLISKMGACPCRSDDWFTVESLDCDTYAISEYRHWEETHCFLLLAREQAVLIDTVLGVGSIRQVTDCLTSLPVTVLTTHAHWDHIGGHAAFANFAVHEAEKQWLTGAFPLSCQAILANLTRLPCQYPGCFRPKSYQVFQGKPQSVLCDGQVLSFGGRQLTVVHTPGHSPGHCCFYEQARGYLFTGDLIYEGCLDAFYPTTDPLLFWQSVQKVRQLQVSRIFPAHHRLSVPVALMDEIEHAFRSLSDRGLLRHGGGIFEFDRFQIHL